jgi:hypothetical protein
MKRSHSTGLFVVGLGCLFVLLGCQQRPAVPTVALEPTEPVVVIVVTATSQPTLPPTNTVPASITPLPALTPVVTTTVTATVRATATRVATRPLQATTVPKTTAAGATPNPPGPTAPPSNFAAPKGIAPEGKTFRDGDTINFQFTSAGQLAADECYRLDMTLTHPSGPGGVADWWTGLCGNSSPAGAAVTFPVKPGRFRDQPNYGTLLIDADREIPPTPIYVMQWVVSVVKVLNSADPIHPQVQPLSSPSAPLQNSFFR